jgi:hypothetical protein
MGEIDFEDPPPGITEEKRCCSKMLEKDTEYFLEHGGTIQCCEPEEVKYDKRRYCETDRGVHQEGRRNYKIRIRPGEAITLPGISKYRG